MGYVGDCFCNYNGEVGGFVKVGCGVLEGGVIEVF